MSNTNKSVYKILDQDLHPRGSRIIKVEVDDLHQKANPKLHKDVNDEIHGEWIPKIEEYKRQRGEDYRHGEQNDITDSFFGKSEVLKKWAAMMPSAAALYPLQKPENKKLADGTPFDDVCERYFPHALDGVGLRSRAKVMTSVMVDHFKDYEIGQPIKWASLASGAAIPVFEALEQLSDHQDDIELMLADIDPKALEFATKLADEEHGVAHVIKPRRLNILRLKKMQRVVGQNSQDAVDILGFFEYLPAKPWRYRKYKIRLTMPGAIDFLRAAYTLVKPGGMLVLGNMSDEHPQKAFTTQVVRWPYIRPRSVDEVLDIVEAAGIDLSKVTVYRISDQVYSVLSIEK